MRAHEKLIPEKYQKAMTNPRPPLEGSWQGKSKSAWTIFVKFIFDMFFHNSFPNIVQRKIVKEEPDLSHQKLLFRGLISY